MWPLTDGDPRQLGGYRLLFRLGAGGMGQVYLARSGGGRYVALKMIHPGLASAPGFRERFAREIRVSQAVDGAGTVPVVGADAQASTPWLASAYVPGPSLAEAVHDHGPLPEAAAWRLLSGLAEALSAVHGHGLVHRDLKPSNVLMSQDGPRLIDFGIARAADDTALTGTGMAVGSAGYMSPEQAEGREVTAAGDVFALGALLVYAATGRGPFGAGSGPDVLYRVVHNEPELGQVPEALAAVVRRCLAKRPEERPSLTELRALAAEHDAGERDWLPGPVASEIARRAERLLNLETTDSTQSTGSADSTDPPTPTMVDPRAPTMPRRTEPPRARPAPWVRGQVQGRLMLSLCGLVPMLAMLVIAPQKRRLVEIYNDEPENEDLARLANWAQDNDWFLLLTVLLAVALICLLYVRTRLDGYTERGLRTWTAATAFYWLLWAGAIVLNAAWYVGMEAVFDSEDWGRSGVIEAGYFAVDRGVGWLLIANAVAAPFAAVAAIARLSRAATAEVTERSA
jgi:serine/threonine protein kinase